MRDTPLLKLSFPPFELDEGDARLSKVEGAVAVTPKAFAVLCALARRPAQLVTKGELLDEVWGHQHVSESVLKTIVSELRAALGDDARQPRFIETAARRGYRFIAPLGAAAAARGPDGAVAPAGAPPAASSKAVDRADAWIGRRDELGRLHGSWDRVGQGGKRVVWVSGEAGIGKTTLIDRFLATIPGTRVARGQCVEQFGAGEPYLPVLEALAGWCRADPALPVLIRSVAPSWLAQLPWLSTEAERALLQRDLAGSHPDRMLRELAELLDRASATQPLLLVTEDLHWSDHATVRLINYVARSRGPACVLWLGSFRPADAIATDHPLVALRHELRAQGLSDELALDPFSEREIGEYLEGRFLSTRAGGPFVRALHANTEGLPLFVASVVDDLVAQGEITGGEGGFPSTVGHVPANVAGVIERRIGRLADDELTLIQAASVCGVEFHCSTVAAAIDGDASAVTDRCERLSRRDPWLHEVDLARRSDGSLDTRFRFRHALHRQVLYERIGAQARARLHRRVAEALVRGRTTGEAISAAEIALHFDKGREPAAALRHYADAVESALERLAPVEAVQLIERAMALLPQCPPNEARAQLELVLSARRGITCPLLAGFGSPEAQAAFERARDLCGALPHTPERAWIMNGLGWVYFSCGDYAASLPWAYRALAIGMAHDDPAIAATACDLAGYCLVHQGGLAEARMILEQGIAAVGSVRGGFPKSLLRTHDPEVSLRSVVRIPLGRMGLVEEVQRQSKAALARAEMLGEPLAQLLAYWAAAIDAARLDRPDDVLAWAESLERLFRERQMLTAEAPALWFRGLAQARTHDAVGGHALIVAGIARHERLGRLAGITQPLIFAAEAMVRCGRWDEAQAHVEQGLRMADRLGEQVYRPDLLIQQARIDAGRGRPGAARAALDNALALTRDQQALWIELEALAALCELEQGTSQPHLGALLAARARLPESSTAYPLVNRVETLLAPTGAAARP